MNEAYKKELRKDICWRTGRFIFSKALPFNTVNDPFWLLMVDGIASFDVGFKPPSMHELRTWILKEEVEDIDTYLLVHKKLGDNMVVPLCQMVGPMEKAGF